jgi:Domain of unknown function (DUF4440)
MRLSPVGCALSLLVVVSMSLDAQTVSESDPSASGPLYDELARMDSILFDAAFVSCDIEKTNSLFTDDIEFYHDKTGLERGQQVRESFRRLTASCPRDRGIRRELVAGTLRVYPIKDYGAVQMGVHRFVQRGASTYTVARFVTLWQKKDGGWIIPRVLSFDHLPMPVESGSRPTPSTP